MSNNMLDILKNLDAAEKGEKKFSSVDSSGMKSILESFDKVDRADEAPMPVPMDMPTSSMPPVAPPEDKGQPVSMNVSVNASGKENVQDLLDLMKMAGINHSEPDGDELGKIGDAELDIDLDGDHQPDIALQPKEEYENDPEEEYKDTQYMTKDLSGGINREKKAYAKAQDGDNAMAVESIKERLLQALESKKKS
jgi:hypothetical protein